MKRWAKSLLPLACCAMLSHSLPAVGDDDDDKAAGAGKPGSEATLNREQQRAVGIVIAHPLPAKAPQRFEALGVVLDPSALISAMGETTAAAAAEESASAEFRRLQALYKGGAGASLKMLETAQADQARALSESQSAAARFALHWGPVAGLPQGARLKLLAASSSGRSLLLRADLPGRHSLGELPSEALVTWTGFKWRGHVLGALRQTSELQSAGLLIEVKNAPLGLGPGARVPVALLTGQRAGLLLPRDALLYDETGAYVYKQLVKKAGEEKSRFAAVKVTLLGPYGDGWLVKGIDDDDDIVVHGVGVLWSLQGITDFESVKLRGFTKEKEHLFDSEDGGNKFSNSRPRKGIRLQWHHPRHPNFM